MWSWYMLLLALLCVLQCNGAITTVKRREDTKLGNSLRAPMSLGAPAHLVNGDHISFKFYEAVVNGNEKKNNLQFVLQNFVENLQKNMSTSSILNTIANGMAIEQNKMDRLYDLADYFEYSSEMAKTFAIAAENFFEISKNESIALLDKLRHVPTAQRFLPDIMIMRLTDYFAEMEFFNVMFSEVIDEALEYIVDTLRSIQNVFIRYADIQRDVLRTWDIRKDDWCRNAYIDFLQLWSTEIFKCASTKDLNIAYDVYATTETTSKHIMRQLEFRIQRLFNCFIFGGYQTRCQFLRNPENDFQALLVKLDDLQQYLDIKIKRGRITTFRSRRQSVQQTPYGVHGQCIPPGFPEKQMIDSLKQCFDFLNEVQA